MFRRQTIVIPSLFLVALMWNGSTVMASGSHGDMGGMQHEKGMQHGDEMQHGGQMHHGDQMQHGGQMQHGSGMIMLGEATTTGIKAMAHLKDSREQMAQLKMPTTHHLMIQFTDVGTGAIVDSGSAVATIKAPSGKETKGLQMMGMGGHFGKDIALTERGTYEIMVDTVLADGKARRYRFTYSLQ